MSVFIVQLLVLLSVPKWSNGCPTTLSGAFYDTLDLNKLLHKEGIAEWHMYAHANEPLPLDSLFLIPPGTHGRSSCITVRLVQTMGVIKLGLRCGGKRLHYTYGIFTLVNGKYVIRRIANTKDAPPSEVSRVFVFSFEASEQVFGMIQCYSETKSYGFFALISSSVPEPDALRLREQLAKELAGVNWLNYTVTYDLPRDAACNCEQALEMYEEKEQLTGGKSRRKMFFEITLMIGFLIVPLVKLLEWLLQLGLK